MKKVGCHSYKRGSLDNKIGMLFMWMFYGIVIIQLIHAFIVLPFFPIWEKRKDAASLSSQIRGEIVVFVVSRTLVSLPLDSDLRKI